MPPKNRRHSIILDDYLLPSHSLYHPTNPHMKTPDNPAFRGTKLNPPKGVNFLKPTLRYPKEKAHFRGMFPAGESTLAISPQLRIFNLRKIPLSPKLFRP
jgi:hypothetical protein